MAMKKKTTKKASAGAGTTAKTSAKASSMKTTKKISKKASAVVDRMLVKMSPQLKGKIGRLVNTLEESRAARVGDLSLLASQILLRAQEVSRSLRGIKEKKEPKK